MRRTSPVRIHRSCFAPNGGAIEIQCTGFEEGPAGNLSSPGVTSTWTSCPRAASPSATAVT
jgi:hypothetical protein